MPEAPETDYAAMQPGDMLAAVGTDGMKWADAFMQTACMDNPLGRELRAFPHGDREPLHGTMLGWFCNAIEAGRSAGAQGMRRGVYPMFDEAVICEPIVGEAHLTIRYQSTRDAHAAYAALVNLAREAGIVGPSVATEGEAREAMADSFASDFDAGYAKGYAAARPLDPGTIYIGQGEANASTEAHDAAFAKGAGENVRLINGTEPGVDREPEGGPEFSRWKEKTEQQPEPPTSKQVSDLAYIARQFIDKHRIGCAEDTVEDRVYENAPGLVEQLAEVVGYYRDPEAQ